MREAKAKSIRLSVIEKLAKKGLIFTKREYRRIKKFYIRIPWNKKHEFEMT